MKKKEIDLYEKETFEILLSKILDVSLKLEPKDSKELSVATDEYIIARELKNKKTKK